MCNDETFLTERVTNRDIYRKLMDVESRVTKQNTHIAWHSKAIGGLFVIVCGLIGLVGAV